MVGIDSLSRVRYTAKANSTVMDSPIFSPASLGKAKVMDDVRDRKMMGRRTFRM